jgi:hypothetical protein
MQRNGTCIFCGTRDAPMATGAQQRFSETARPTDDAPRGLFYENLKEKAHN